MSIKRNLNAVFAVATVLSASGCVTMPSAQELDAKFAAGWRPSKSYCAFGGETPALSAWCAEVNFGAEGLEVIARAVNDEVLTRAGGQPLVCTDHVAQVRQGFAGYPGYKVTELYSCDANPPMENGRAVCHVSLMVTSATGARVVLDNGHVLDPAATGGVAPYREFAQLVDRNWTGETPAWVALASR
jgi:hypothetical protein